MINHKIFVNWALDDSLVCVNGIAVADASKFVLLCDRKGGDDDNVNDSHKLAISELHTPDNAGLTASSRTAWLSQPPQERQTILDCSGPRVGSCRGIKWTMYKSIAPCSRQLCWHSVTQLLAGRNFFMTP